MARFDNIEIGDRVDSVWGIKGTFVDKRMNSIEVWMDNGWNLDCDLNGAYWEIDDLAPTVWPVWDRQYSLHPGLCLISEKEVDLDKVEEEQ